MRTSGEGGEDSEAAAEQAREGLKQAEERESDLAEPEERMIQRN
jgi:hypothetical protein